MHPRTSKLKRKVAEAAKAVQKQQARRERERQKHASLHEASARRGAPIVRSTTCKDVQTSDGDAESGPGIVTRLRGKSSTFSSQRTFAHIPSSISIPQRLQHFWHYVGAGACSISTNAQASPNTRVDRCIKSGCASAETEVKNDLNTKFERDNFPSEAEAAPAVCVVYLAVSTANDLETNSSPCPTWTQVRNR